MSAAEARRIALAAQGFADQRPSRPDLRHIRRVLAQIGLLQIDSVNVLVRSHYLPLFSRLGPYPSSILENVSWGSAPKRELFEYWGHMASLLPHDLHRLLRWRMQDAEQMLWHHGGIVALNQRRPGFLRAVLEEVAARGPLSARELTDGGPRRGKWWGWSDGKIAMEHLFAIGRVGTAGRRGFERIYDLPERIMPARVLDAPTPSREEAHRELMRIAARALGVATARDLCDYFRIALVPGRKCIEELVEACELIPVAVEGWGQPAYLERDARVPRKVDGCAVLSPFDSLVWERARTERVFGFHYRIEIYTPSAHRKHGYYVLPFLLGDRLVARVDLKADRASSTLQVIAAHAEAEVDRSEVGEAMMGEMRAMASWLGLERLTIARRGNLARNLRA
jgi:uncharacterized protein